NATGPWAGNVPHSRVQLRLTKGIHLVIDRRRLPVPDAVVITEGKRILFVIPWGERVILGTTDTDYDGDIQAVRVGSEDITYRLIAEQAVDRVVKSLQESHALHKKPGPCRTSEEALLAEAEVSAISGILPSEFGRRSVEHFCAKEWAVHLDDVMVRRSGWHY